MSKRERGGRKGRWTRIEWEWERERAERMRKEDRGCLLEESEGNTVKERRDEREDLERQLVGRKGGSDSEREGREAL